MLARILHRYDLVADPDYELKIEERLTIVPRNLRMGIRRRTPQFA